MRLFVVVWLTGVSLSIAAEPSWPVVLPMTMEKNLPLVEIAVNGTEALRFILDSAAEGCVIDHERALAIGLPVNGSATASGSNGRQQVALIEGVRLSVGGIRIVPPHTFAFEMKTLAFKGRVDGILGFPLFGHYVVEIDYLGSQVRIFQPESYRPSQQAQEIPLRMTTGPVVRGSVRVRDKAPIEADFQLYTGSAHVLTLCTSFVDRHNLLEPAEGKVAGTTLGVGGEGADVVGRIEEVRIGRFSMQRPTVRFSRRTGGSLASEDEFSANLGGEFLKRYKVTFDIPGSRLFLE
jgi:hypothetical protein